MRYINYAFWAIVAVCLIILGLANRELVALRALPDGLASLIGVSPTIELPLFVAIFLGVAIGLLVGFVWEWLREHKHRAAAGKSQREARVLQREVDRLKAKAQGVPLTELFDTLQTYLGSTYVNDFNRFGRTWQVIAQADAPHRDSVEDIARLRTRNDQGEMVPIGSMVNIRQSFGPDPVLRYNGYPAADIAGEADPRVLSSAQAMDTLTALADQVLPSGMAFEWTDLSYQQATQGNAALVVFPLAILLVFLVLAALYESWTLPLAVILIVPMCMLSALIGVWFGDGDNNIFVQVGLVVLIGLACKNAILIVEFARELELQGRSIVEAALEACRLRLRPIIMTSITFTAAVVPLVLATGAGAEVREALGTAVFAGMIGVTLFGLFLTPVFYVALRKLSGSHPLKSHHTSTLSSDDGDSEDALPGGSHA